MPELAPELGVPKVQRQQRLPRRREERTLQPGRAGRRLLAVLLVCRLRDCLVQAGTREVRPRLVRPRPVRPRLVRPRLVRPRLVRPRLVRPRLVRPRLRRLRVPCCRRICKATWLERRGSCVGS